MATKIHFGRASALGLLFLGILFGVIFAAPGAAALDNTSPKLKPIPPCAALAAVANLNHIPLEGAGAPSGTNSLHSGDSATVLVTFIQKKKQTQWLLRLEAITPDPAKPVEKSSTFVVNSSFGPPEKFISRPVPVKLRMFGPFTTDGPAKQTKMVETEAKFLLNEGFLGLGLDQAAALMFRWSQTTNFTNAVTSKALLAVKPTPEEQRAVCAVFPALISYFNIVQHTEGLEGLLRKLIETPSMWSLIRHGGVDADISFGNGFAPSPADPKEWNLPTATPVYHFPWLLRLNGQPAMKITLLVTGPKPPLLICGGVVGLLAEKIDDDESYMTLKVVSTEPETKGEK